MDLLDKLKPLADRHQMMLKIGRNAVGLRMDDVISPTRAIVDGKEIILAGTNNYMGTTFDEDCIKAGQEALEKFGTGTTGSRIANGSYAMHQELEEEIKHFFDLNHAIVFSTGYQANLGMICGLAGRNDDIFLDADSHASIYDGSTLSGSQIIRFKHNDPESLAKRLARSDDNRGKLVILEGLYSIFGDRAPLAEFIDVKREYGFTLLLDEAHSAGVLGDNGRGLAEEAGFVDEVDFIVGTFSKSFGSIGGFGAGNNPLLEVIRVASHPYMFTASPSPSTIATTIAAIKMLRNKPQLRDAIRNNSMSLYNGLKDLGLDLCCDIVSPIIAVKMVDEPSTVMMWNALLEAGLYVNIALPPGTPNGTCLLRCSVSAVHSQADINDIIDIFAKCFNSSKLITERVA